MAATGRPRNTTIVDIARKLGTSVMTVSRALNDKGDVSQEMRRKVIECAQALGYRPNRWARSLVTQRSLMIGVVIPEIAHSFFAEIISGIEAVVEGAGYDILLCHSRSDPAREQAELHALIETRVDGLIVAPVQPEKSPGPLLELQKRKMPLVLVDRFFPGWDFSSVRMDDAVGGYMATEFLIKLGHRRIAHIAGPGLSPASLRRKGYLKAMRAYGLEVEKSWIVTAPFGVEEGRKAMNKLLAADPRPTAVFACTDPQALGALYACREAGLHVPKDVSVVGAGNIEGVFYPDPVLTTLDWPREELGRLAAKMLLEAIANPKSVPRSNVFTPALLVRHSTAAPKAAVKAATKRTTKTPAKA